MKPLKLLLIGIAIGFLVARWLLRDDLSKADRERLQAYEASEADMDAFMREQKARKAARGRKDAAGQADDVLRRYVGDES